MALAHLLARLAAIETPQRGRGCPVSLLPLPPKQTCRSRHPPIPKRRLRECAAILRNDADEPGCRSLPRSYVGRKCRRRPPATRESGGDTDTAPVAAGLAGRLPLRPSHKATTRSSSLVPRIASTLGRSFRICPRYRSTRHPRDNQLRARPVFLCAAISQNRVHHSCLAGSDEAAGVHHDHRRHPRAPVTFVTALTKA